MLTITPFLEIILEILWVVVAFGLIIKAHFVNKNSKSFSVTSALHANAEEAAEGFSGMFIAVGLLAGIAMLILLSNKIIICGVICGSLLP
jgi:hypothetical protein